MEHPSARRVALIAAILAGFLALVPYLFAAFVSGKMGATYLGMQMAVDDNMVYAAWMRQAMDGRFLFDNRFTTDSQPGLTIHVWFLVLGWIAKVFGIPLSLALTRALCSGLFVWMVYQLARRVSSDPYVQKIAVVVVTLGGGLGFLAWQDFGNAFSGPHALSGLLGGRLPIDVWQTEAFVFPSILANGLFMVSLCLILGIWICVLDARTSAKPVWKGALCFLVLMNIHSYDVLLVTLCLLGFLVASAASKTLDRVWVLRVVVMGLGAVPAALWFAYVLKNDVVFQSRAATLTYSPTFKQIAFGLLPLMGFALWGWFNNIRTPVSEEEGQRAPAGDRQKALIAVGAMALLILGLFAASSTHTDTNVAWMGWPGFVACLASAFVVVWLGATAHPGKNLVLAWAAVGLVAPYFPALFQRKLAMGIEIPWALATSCAMGLFLTGRDRGMRNMAAIGAIVLLSGTSVRWLSREMDLAKGNVSSTTVHPVYMDQGVTQIMRTLVKQRGSHDVVLAMPGIATPLEGGGFAAPYLPDLNPIASGLTGVYSIAGHWSETPNYGGLRGDATKFFLGNTDPKWRESYVRNKGVRWIIAPLPEAFPDFHNLTNGIPLADVRAMGRVVVEGNQFCLIELGTRN